MDATAKRLRKNHSRFAPRSAAPKISKGPRVTPSRGRRLELEAAEEAGLRYVSENQPGYTRKAKGDDFEYFDTEGKAVGDEQRLLRIKRLAIPPAWTDVWISPTANGHMQATGRDARNRKQYIYHERWREVRDENKYERMIVFGKALPKIRRRVKHLCAIADFHPRRTLTRCAGLAANRRQNRDRNFSCDTTRFFGGADAAASFAAMGPL